MRVGCISITKGTNRERLDVCGHIWTLSWRMIVLRIKIFDIPAEGRRWKGQVGVLRMMNHWLWCNHSMGESGGRWGGSREVDKWSRTFKGPREFSWYLEGNAEPRRSRAISTTFRRQTGSCFIGCRECIRKSASNEEVLELVHVSEKKKLNQHCWSGKKRRESRHLGNELEKSIFNNLVIWASCYLSLPD